MNYTLTRQSACLYGVFGSLVSEDGKNSFVTLEHAYAIGPNVWGAKLAPGVYKCIRRQSPRLGYEVFCVAGVPDFMGSPVSYIEIHIGNYNNDSEGCVLPGLKKGIGMIEDSRIAFDAFMASEAGQDEFTLTVA